MISTGRATTPAATKRKRRRPDSILVFGQQKTGTTGMYNTVKSALAPVAQDYFFFFEPTKESQIRTIRKTDPTLAIMAKVIAHRISSRFPIDSFQRRVMMFRDPRDTLISNLLFKPLIRATLDITMDRHEQFIAALERKEADPSSVSVNELLELGVSLGYRHSAAPKAREMQDRFVEIGQAYDFHFLSYERFVDRDVDDVSEYLGLDLHVGQPDGSTWLDHISRSRDYGAWRHWFTPSDVDYYRKEYQEFLEHFGYGDDWELADRQVLDPATSSMHVRASLAKRRSEFAADSTGGRERTSGFDLHTTYTMAQDGSSRAALAVAKHLLELDRGYVHSARYWAHRAAVQGSPEGKQLRDKIDRRLSPRPPKPARPPAATGAPATPPATEPKPGSAPTHGAANNPPCKDISTQRGRAMASLRVLGRRLFRSARR